MRMLDVDVIENAAAAAAALDPVKSRLLAELAQPASAAGLADRVGLARQKINYHLRALEQHGLIEVADQRKWGGLTERRMIATAASYIVSPAALGPVASNLDHSTDHLSAGYMVALSARVVREVGTLWRRARQAGKRLATLSIETEIRFRSAAERSDFTRELTQAVAALVARYHDETAVGGRPHRLVLLTHPMPLEHSQENTSCP